MFDFEQDACWDAPSNRDILYSELMGDTIEKTYPERVLWGEKNTVYNQGLEAFTKMACGSYGTIHGVNIYNMIDGEYELDPKDHWNLFVKAYKTDSYDPVKQGSSLQNQVDFGVKTKHLAGYVRINKLKKQEYMENLAEGRCILTGSSNINWRKTRDSKDKFAVIEKGAGHIFLIVGYDKIGLICMNSYGPDYMDKGKFYIRWEDIGALFSCYALLDYKDNLRAIVKNKIMKRQRELALTKVYETRINPATGKKLRKWRPK